MTFIRYIELIDKNNAKIEGENGAVGNGVRIMTIHKSKGLEFPVVFLSGCGGRFNKTDLNDNVVLHKNLGIGSEYIDTETRVKYNTVPKAVITEAIWQDQGCRGNKSSLCSYDKSKGKAYYNRHVRQQRRSQKYRFGQCLRRADKYLFLHLKYYQPDAIWIGY